MTIDYRREGDVAIVTLDRPEKYNSVSADLSRGLIEAIARAGTEARAMILTGAGKAFCAGADLSGVISDTTGRDLASLIDDQFNPMVQALVDAPVPTIAAVNGVAAGAGLGLALACDVRVMSSQAYFLSAFIGLALIPDTGSTWLLVHHLGLSRAIEFTSTNRRMLGEEVAALRLARICPPEELLAQAVTLGDEFAAGPTTAYVANRKILFGAAACNFSAALEAERVTQGELGRTALHREGVSAFLEKRKPDFREK
jgi:2-(1,2-epoxy-1,2-dihydrophenyl)acetyl-CoA isomerase